MNQKLLFYGTAIGVALVLIGMTRLTTGTGGLLAAAGAYDQYGYNRIAREFKGTGANWCIANKQDKACLGEYALSTFLIKWNADWDKGNKDAWVLTPYNATVTVQVDGTTYTVTWVGNCADGEVFQSGGTCVWGEYAASADNGTDPTSGVLGTWLTRASPSVL